MEPGHSRKSRILLVTARADYGGGPEYVYRLLSALKDKSDFYLACPDDYPYMEKYRSIVGPERIVTIPHRKFDLISLINLIKFAVRNKIDIIHSHGKGGGIYSRPAALLAGIKCVHTFHGIHTGEYGPLAKKLYLVIEKFFTLLTVKAVAVSESEKSVILQNGIAPENKIFVIPNGVAIPDEAADPPGSDTRLNVITVTRFDFAKNSMLFTEIIKEVMNRGEQHRFKFIFIGDGPELARVQERISESGAAELTEFTGFTCNVAEYYKKAFCCVSTSRWEGLPLSVLEAMSFGVPVIATDVSGNRDAVRHSQSGYLFNPEKPADAADYLIKLVYGPDLWKQMSYNSRKLCIESFSFERTAEENLELYNKLTEKIT